MDGSGGAAFASPSHSLAPQTGMDEADAEEPLTDQQIIAVDHYEVVSTLVRQECSSTEAVRRIGAICTDRALDHRQQAVHPSGAQAMVHEAAAADLDAQAASFYLIASLCGDDESRAASAGDGGPQLQGCGRAQTVRQHIADIIATNAGLNRVARVVAWLEALASDALDREADRAAEEGGALLAFAPDEGLPRETRSLLLTGAGSRPSQAPRGQEDTVTELDPDAVTRQGRPFAAGDARDEERLAARLFRLVRAGRLRDAEALCKSTGLHWQQVLFDTGDALGLIPVGLAAAEADTEAAERGEEALAAEIQHGGCASRLSWRRANFEAAEQAGRQADASGSQGRHSAAVSAVFASHLPRILPVCNSWQDRLWAAARAWLEVAVDILLSQEDQSSADITDAIAHELKCMGLTSASQLYEGLQGLDKGILPDGSSWPPSSVLDNTPRSWDAVFELVNSTCVDDSAWQATHHRLQQCLISAIGEQLDDVLSILTQPDLSMDLDGDIGADRMEGSDYGDVASDDAVPQMTLEKLRCHVHIALALMWLRMISMPCNLPSFTALLQGVEQLLVSYCVQLVDMGKEELVTLYTCHLSSDARRQIIGLAIAAVTAEPSARCWQWYEAVDSEFFQWKESGFGVLEDDELHLIIDGVVARSLCTTDGGPMSRAMLAKWAFYGKRLHYAFGHLNRILCDFAVSGSPGSLEAADASVEDMSAFIPLEILRDDPQVRVDRSIDEDVVPLVTETCNWSTFFDLERAWRHWQAAHDRVLGQAPGSSPAAQQEAAALLQQHVDHTLELLQQALDMAALRTLDGTRAADTEAEADAEAEAGGGQPLAAEGLHIMASTPLAAMQDADTLAGNAYPLLSMPAATDIAAELEDRVHTFLSSTESPRQVLSCQVQAVGEEQQALVSLQIKPLASSSAQAVAKLAGLLLKGALPAAGGSQSELGAAEGSGARPQRIPLEVVGLRGSAQAAALLVREMCYPRWVLRIAYARQEICRLLALPASLSSAVDTVVELSQLGQSVKELVVGHPDIHSQGDLGFPGLAPCFCQYELADFIELDRHAEVISTGIQSAVSNEEDDARQAVI